MTRAARGVPVAVLLVLSAACARRPAADPARGKAFFEANCAVCHSATTELRTGPALGGLFRRPALRNGKPVDDANVERFVRDGTGVMPAFGDRVTAEEMRDLLAYLRGL